MRAIKRGRSRVGDIEGAISPAQRVVLEYILVNGPSSASDITNLSPSTAQASMKRLNERGLVQFEREEPIKTGLPKKIFGLTMGGFCFGFNLIAQSKTTNYEMIESVIKRWQHLCPEVLGNWDLLIKERQEMDFPSDGSDKEIYGWQKEQLPYPVPRVGVKRWIIYLDRCCQGMISLYPWSGQTNYSGITSELFCERFTESIVEYVMDMTSSDSSQEFFDMGSMICVIREIPILWEPLHEGLVYLKGWHEKCALRTRQLLEN